VIEGNCRTVCLRELRKKYPDDDRWQMARAYKFPNNVDYQSIAIMLLDFHVAGKSEWDAYEQARLLWDLNRNHGMSYDALASHSQLQRNKLANMLAAYDLTQEYLVQNPDPENIKKYSYFQEAHKKREIRERLETAEFKKDLFRWIESSKLTDSRQIRGLPEILENAAARSALEERGFGAAYGVLVAGKPAMTSDLFAAVEQATERIKQAPLDEIKDLRRGNVEKINLLQDLSRALEDLAAMTDIELHPLPTVIAKRGGAVDEKYSDNARENNAIKAFVRIGISPEDAKNVLLSLSDPPRATELAGKTPEPKAEIRRTPRRAASTKR